MFTVYVVYNSNAKKIYIGQTDDINRRISEHNSHRIPGFTARYQGEWELIHSESFATRTEALLREKQLKSHQGRDYIKSHIRG